MCAAWRGEEVSGSLGRVVNIGRGAGEVLGTLRKSGRGIDGGNWERRIEGGGVGRDVYMYLHTVYLVAVLMKMPHALLVLDSPLKSSASVPCP